MKIRYKNTIYNISNGKLLFTIICIIYIIYVTYNAFIFSTLAPDSVRRFDVYDKYYDRVKDKYYYNTGTELDPKGLSNKVKDYSFTNKK